MAFNSLSYFLFLPLVWLVFQWTPDRLRWLLLLLASLGFYAMLNAPYLVAVLGVVSGATYAVGLQLAGCDNDAGRKRLLWTGIGVNLLILVSLKYLPAMLAVFPLHSSLSIFDFSPFTFHFSLLVTIGVSYYVFQAISYLIDVYLEIELPERHFGYFALYISFFPKLLQGPIERAGDLLPQLKKPYAFNYENMRTGMLMFAWGLFKKVVVADRLALFVNTVYGNVHAYTGLPLILATYLYAFQLYFDFSGYTDMALGTARLFNIRLTQNFNSPYLATSIADFWRRWHISFSRWILDYIFKPLQLLWRDLKSAGTALALIVTFLASGIWHGARWGFVIWGLLHGLYLASSVYYRPLQKKLHKAMMLDKTRTLAILQTVVTFNLVCFAWIFFRAVTVNDALYVATHLWSGVSGIRTLLFFHGTTELVVTILLLAVLVAVHLLSTGKQGYPLLGWPAWYRWPVYCLLLLATSLLYIDGSRQFIYFQF